MFKSPIRFNVMPCHRAAIRAAESPAVRLTDFTKMFLWRSNIQMTTKRSMNRIIMKNTMVCPLFLILLLP